jgi:uncharacterized protein
VTKRQSRPKTSLQPIDISQIKILGEIGRRIDATVKNNLLVLNVEDDFLKPFREKSNADLVGLGFLVDASVRFAAYTGDRQVMAFKKHIVDETLAAQEMDGYIGTKPPEARIFTLLDIQEMSYVVTGLTSDYRFFGEKESLEAAKKLANYLIKRWSGEPMRALAPKSHLAVHNITAGLEPAMLMLYQETGDTRYLKFVTNFLKLKDWKGRIVRGRWDRLEGHAYTHITLCLAQLRLSRLLPTQKKYRNSTDELLDFVLNKNGMVITGECGDHECWHDTQEGSAQLGETCATAYMIRLLNELIQIDGNSLYGDLMERIIYNGLFAAQSADGRRIRYFTPLDGKRSYFGSASEFSEENLAPDTYCCPNNFRRIMSELASMIFYTFPKGIAVNLYTSCDAKIDLTPQLSVKVRQETDYPSSGNVKIYVDPNKAGRFTIRFRIPRWVEGKTSIKINNNLVARKVRHGTYQAISRMWHPGDVLELELPMPVRLVRGRLAQAGRVAIMRGPQVYCLASSRAKGIPNIDLHQAVINPESAKGAFEDISVRPNGTLCSIQAWGPSEWYPRGFNQIEKEYKPGLKLEMTEFPDPEGEITYVKVPYPSETEFVDDELLTGGN